MSHSFGICVCVGVYTQINQVSGLGDTGSTLGFINQVRGRGGTGSTLGLAVHEHFCWSGYRQDRGLGSTGSTSGFLNQVRGRGGTGNTHGFISYMCSIFVLLVFDITIFWTNRKDSNNKYNQ
jgi:hypothetical protein